jgi:hypothetical protein
MLQFKDLWFRHPANEAVTYPCVAQQALTSLEGKEIARGYPVFSNQCAIRLGVALKRAGVPPQSLRGLVTCGVHAPEELHIIRAADLARALARIELPGLGKLERITGKDAAEFYPRIFGRTGIIYLQDYWRRTGETNPTGDHIDVWNGYRSSTKWLMEWFSWLGYYSNYADAKEIWFWEVK